MLLLKAMQNELLKKLYFFLAFIIYPVRIHGLALHVEEIF